MEAKSVKQLPLVVIVGPTASGKTALAIDLAEKCGGEIICADSRTVYKGMDIGTAKPTKEEQARVPHWGLNLVEPNEPFSVADFKEYAEAKIKEIRARGNVPFIVGGTGLYVDSIIFDYQFGPPVDQSFRTSLEKMSLKDLHDYCYKNSIKLPENEKNKRYVIRAIEQNGTSKRRSQVPISTSIIVGIATKKDELRKRITLRTEQLFENGVVKEATLLGKKYGWNSEAMTGNIYPLLRLYLNNELSLAGVKEKFITLDWRLAKRQLTWLKRNPHIKWGTAPELRTYLLDKLLANE